MYIIVGLVYLTIALALFGLIVFIIKIPKLSLGLVAVLCISIFLYYKQSLKQHHLSLIPAQLHVAKVTYVSEKSWGIGLPGDNETGLIEYELPDDVAKKITKEGMNYFLNLQKETVVIWGERRHDVYGEWYETPIFLSDAWQGTRYNNEETVSKTTFLSIENYLDRYGFPVPINPKVGAMIDYVISIPGSYYAYGGGGGVLIVIPAEQKVIYAYAG
jgi:hypothetical protein